jgi:hypothetical protein
MVINRESNESISEDIKQSLIRKAKFEILSKTFYDPEGVVIHAR